MKKRIIAVGLSILFILSLLSFGVLAENERVEISFCVGDETLMINGEAVVVEKPYVVGAGVTLVPLRVITEAFGAEVLWEGETKTITLNYPDVNIVLQIGNPIAEINGRAEELLAAPELTPNGFTVVPLRFISENFGAEVSYDEATKRITVIKEKAEAGKTVEGNIESEYIGDSYFRWSMKTPAEMSMQERRFDGRYTLFAYDDNNYTDISIYNVGENEYNVDKEFTAWKQDFKDMTLVKADKDNDAKKIHIRAKSKNMQCDVVQVATDNYVYVVYSEFDAEHTDVRDAAFENTETFALTFDKNTTYDLSNVVGDTRIFEAKAMGLFILLPADYIMDSNPDVETEYNFIGSENEKSLNAVDINIYSKFGTNTGAEALGWYELSQNKMITNPDVNTYSEKLETQTTQKGTFWWYDSEYKGKNYGYFMRDIFFEADDYLYNVAIYENNFEEGYKEDVDKIMSSITVTKPDAAALGTVIYTKGEAEGTFKVDSIGSVSFDLPNDFEYMSGSSYSAVYGNGRMVVSVVIQTDKSYYPIDIMTMAKDYEERIKSTDGYELVEKTSETINEVSYTVVTTVTDNAEKDEIDSYCETFFGLKDDVSYSITVIYDEMFFSDYSKNIARDIIKSIKEK